MVKQNQPASGLKIFRHSCRQTLSVDAQPTCIVARLGLIDGNSAAEPFRASQTLWRRSGDNNFPSHEVTGATKERE
jgi:hypothetical protein